MLRILQYQEVGMAGPWSPPRTGQNQLYSTDQEGYGNFKYNKYVKINIP